MTIPVWLRWILNGGTIAKRYISVYNWYLKNQVTNLVTDIYVNIRCLCVVQEIQYAKKIRENEIPHIELMRRMFGRQGSKREAMYSTHVQDVEKIWATG